MAAKAATVGDDDDDVWKIAFAARDKFNDEQQQSRVATDSLSQKTTVKLRDSIETTIQGLYAAQINAELCYIQSMMQARASQCVVTTGDTNAAHCALTTVLPDHWICRAHYCVHVCGNACRYTEHNETEDYTSCRITGTCIQEHVARVASVRRSGNGGGDDDDATGTVIGGGGGDDDDDDDPYAKYAYDDDDDDDDGSGGRVDRQSRRRGAGSTRASSLSSRRKRKLADVEPDERPKKVSQAVLTVRQMLNPLDIIGLAEVRATILSLVCSSKKTGKTRAWRWQSVMYSDAFTRDTCMHLATLVHRLFCRLFAPCREDEPSPPMSTIYAFAQLCLHKMRTPGGFRIQMSTDTRDDIVLIPYIPWLVPHVTPPMAQLSTIRIVGSAFTHTATTTTRSHDATILGKRVSGIVKNHDTPSTFSFHAVYPVIDGGARICDYHTLVSSLTDDDDDDDNPFANAKAVESPSTSLWQCVCCNRETVGLREAYIVRTARCYVLPPCTHVLCRTCAVTEGRKCSCAAGRLFTPQLYIPTSGCLLCERVTPETQTTALVCLVCAQMAAEQLWSAAREADTEPVAVSTVLCCSTAPDNLIEWWDGTQLGDSCHFGAGGIGARLAAEIRVHSDREMVWLHADDNDTGEKLAVATPHAAVRSVKPPADGVAILTTDEQRSAYDVYVASKRATSDALYSSILHTVETRGAVMPVSNLAKYPFQALNDALDRLQSRRVQFIEQDSQQPPVLAQLPARPAERVSAVAIDEWMTYVRAIESRSAAVAEDGDDDLFDF